VGSPGVQQYFDNGIFDVDERRKYAEENREKYDRYLKWASVKESLKANGFADESTLRQIDVHYLFLSTFVHPNTNFISDLYGRNVWDWPIYDHYSSELVLLYVIVLAVEELRNFRVMTLREPTVEIDSWSDTEELCDRAWSLSAHLCTTVAVFRCVVVPSLNVIGCSSRCGYIALPPIGCGWLPGFGRGEESGVVVVPAGGGLVASAS
jgi:hypothetical protein